VPIENIGGTYRAGVSGIPHTKADAPDNYPSYGDKSAGKDAIADSVTLHMGESKPDEPAAKPKEKDSKADTEAPDNYPSYGDKGPKKEEAAAEKDPRSIIIIEIEEPGHYYLAEAPDNYPSYGDK
jgi:hypothetical protein